MHFERTVFDVPADVISYFIKHNIYLAPLLLFIEEAGVPIPLPGDVVIIYLGYQVLRGRIPYVTAFLTCFFSILGGASILYLLAYRYGPLLVKKFGGALHLNKKRLVYVEKKFDHYGFWLIVVGRYIPGLRILITAFSGLSEVGYPVFAVSVAISSAIWIWATMLIGEKMGRQAEKLLRVHRSYYVFFLILAVFAIWIILSYRRRRYRQRQETM